MIKKPLCILLICFLSVNLCSCTYGISEEPTLPILVADLGKILHETNLSLPTAASTDDSTTTPTEITAQEYQTKTDLTAETSALETVPPLSEPPVTEPPATQPPETVPLTTEPPVTQPLETEFPTQVPLETVHEHRYNLSTIPATCTGGGYYHYSCGCGESYTCNHTEPLGHDWEEWKTSVEATTSREGEQIRFCSTCGTTDSRKTEQIPIHQGYAISLDEQLSRYPTEGISCLMAYPSETVFGAYYQQAVSLYDAIIYCVNETTISFPVGGYENNKSGLPDAVKQEIENFESLFTETVLQGHILLRRTKASYYSGTAEYEPANINADLIDVAAKKLPIYTALVQAGIYNGMSELDAVLAINEWICSTVTYGESYNSPQETLSSGKTNCTGYAVLFHAMCKNIGIDCQIATGYVTKNDETEGHAWNRVKIGGEWYYIDVCWNDTDYAKNRYLLSNEVWADHELTACEASVYY